LTLCKTSTFRTRLVQLIFSILLQHHISKSHRVFVICFPKCVCFQHHAALLQHPFSSRCIGPYTDRSVNRKYMKRPETPISGFSRCFWRKCAVVSSCYRSVRRVFCFHFQWLLNPDEYKPKLANYRWSVFEHESHIDRTLYMLLILLSHNHAKRTVVWATQIVKIEAAFSPESWAT
jgi:hypothetical protein